jgi:ribosomal protein S18 acetylase RimI-like enzyme
MAGFAITGAAGDNGYLQRVAVTSAHRRKGIAHDLVLDALGWMRHQRLEAALVNTGVDNVAAISLYEGLGFSQLSDRLAITEHRFLNSPGAVA